MVEESSRLCDSLKEHCGHDRVVRMGVSSCSASRRGRKTLILTIFEESATER